MNSAVSNRVPTRRSTMRPVLAFLLLAAAPAAFAAEPKELFEQKCAMCHGESGKGDTKLGQKLKKEGAKLPDFSNAEWQAKRTREKLKGTITNRVPDPKTKPVKG